MEKYSNEKIMDILKSNDFKISKSGSFYKILEIKDELIFKIRISNHKKHRKYKNEIIINYIFKSNKDLNKILKRLIRKFKMVKEATLWNYVIWFLSFYYTYIMIFTMT